MLAMLTKSRRTSGRYDLTLSSISVTGLREGMLKATNGDSPFEYQGLMPWPLTVRKRTHRLRRLVVVRNEKVVKSIVAKSLEEPFSRTC